MNNNELFLALSDLLDQKLEEKSEQKLEQKLKENNALLEARIDAKMEARINASTARLESRLLHMENDVRDIKLKIENVLVPQIQLLTENYVPAAKRFETASDDIVSMKADIGPLNVVVEEHSEKLGRIS